MAIYGIRGYQDRDVTQEFIERNVACIDYGPDEAPALHALLGAVRVGDIMYIKSYTGAEGLQVHAVGLVVDDTVQQVDGLGYGLPVKWLATPDFKLGKLGCKMDVHSNALYEEQHPKVRKLVAVLLIKAAS